MLRHKILRCIPCLCYLIYLSLGIALHHHLYGALNRGTGEMDLYAGMLAGVLLVFAYVFSLLYTVAGAAALILKLLHLATGRPWLCVLCIVLDALYSQAYGVMALTAFLDQSVRTALFLGALFVLSVLALILNARALGRKPRREAALEEL